MNKYSIRKIRDCLYEIFLESSGKRLTVFHGVNDLHTFNVAKSWCHEQ